jgi:hypothetical protein
LGKSLSVEERKPSGCVKNSVSGQKRSGKKKQNKTGKLPLALGIQDDKEDIRKGRGERG